MENELSLPPVTLFPLREINYAKALAEELKLPV